MTEQSPVNVPLLFVRFAGHPLAFSTVDFVLLVALVCAFVYIIATWRNPLNRPQFYNNLSEALNDGDFWLAVAMGCTALGPNVPAPYSTFCYIGTFLFGVYGAALRSDRKKNDPNDKEG